MAPLTPHWTQPSHPDIQDVVKASETEFLTKSFSKVSLPPFAVYAKMSFPPCDLADEPTYATVQCGKAKHLNLNSDLLYINHSCEPSLVSHAAKNAQTSTSKFPQNLPRVGDKDILEDVRLTGAINRFLTRATLMFWLGRKDFSPAMN